MRSNLRLSKCSVSALLTTLMCITSLPLAAATSFYEQHNLVSDGAIPADHTDPNLVNPWGIAFNPTAAVWVSNADSGTSTLYDGAGVPLPLVVEIPGPVPGGDPGSPTGIIFSGSTGFVVSNGTASGPSRFIFATEQGTIVGWAPTVDSTHGITAVNNADKEAIYKGLAISAGGSGNLLYATDFHNGRIDVFDSAFHAVQPTGGFTDPKIPAGFAPFGIQAINGNIYVTYAKQDEAKEDDVRGVGLGYVDIYDPNGFLLRRIATRGVLNAPWGIALAPAGFGRFANRLLIGNFGDGRVNAFDVASGIWVGKLRGSDNQPLAIENLWGLAFGNGFLGQPVNTLYFTAGPDDEEHGLYGSISAKQP